MRGGGMLRQVTILGIGLAVGLVASGCRSGRKASKVGDEPIKMQVELFGLNQEDQNQKDWIYEISGCVNAVNGTLSEENVVTFASTDFRLGQSCQVRIKTSPGSEAGIQFLPGEENVLYWAREVAIGTDVKGGFRARAALQKLFTRKPLATAGSFALRFDTEFDRDENGTLITATLNCDPGIGNVGTYVAQDKRKGWFKFDVAINQDTNYACKTLWVSVGGVGNKYRVDIPQAAGVFTGKVGASVKVETPLKLDYLEPPPVPNGDNVAIEVESVESCTDSGKVFDTTTKTCVNR
jgi:hypothetical protein